MTAPPPPGVELLAAYRHDLLRHYLEQVDSLRASLQAWPEGLEHRPIQPGEWSPHQVLWHVRAVEIQAYIPRLERLLAQDHARLQDFDGQAWMEEHYTTQEAWPRMVADVLAARQRMSTRLEAADKEVWSRVGEHSYWGPRTLMWWVERCVAHLDEHLQQLAIPSPRR